MAICLSEKLWIGLLLLDGGQGQSSYEVDTVDTETKENIPHSRTLGSSAETRRQNNVRRREARNIDTRNFRYVAILILTDSIHANCLLARVFVNWR